jgi:hypothetical protein
MTEGQNISLPWCQEPSGPQHQIFITVTVAGLPMWECSPVGLMTIFYCLRIKAHPSPCIYIPQAKGGPVTSPGIGFPFVAINVDEKESRSQSQRYIMTDNQSDSLSWYQALIWGPRPIFPLLSSIIFRQFRVSDMGRPL